MQLGPLAVVLGQHPRRALGDQRVDAIGHRHGFAQHQAEIALVVGLAAARMQARHLFGVEAQIRAVQLRQLAIEDLGDKTGAATGDVDELADQIGVHAQREILQVEVQIVDAATRFAGVVVAQILRIRDRHRGKCAPG